MRARAAPTPAHALFERERAESRSSSPRRAARAAPFWPRRRQSSGPGPGRGRDACGISSDAERSRDHVRHTLAYRAKRGYTTVKKGSSSCGARSSQVPPVSALNRVAVKATTDERGHNLADAPVRGPWSARAVANTLLEIAEKVGASVTPLKLQKLIYYAHGWALALLGRPLIDEQVQAWKFGPVIESVYHAFKRFGNGRITQLAADFDDSGKPYTPIIPPSAVDERQLLERVWSTYGKFSGVQLSNMTHKPGSPWSRAWQENTEGLRAYAIDNRELAKFFRDKAAQNQANERRGP